MENSCEPCSIFDTRPFRVKHLWPDLRGVVKLKEGAGTLYTRLTCETDKRLFLFLLLLFLLKSACQINVTTVNGIGCVYRGYCDMPKPTHCHLHIHSLPFGHSHMHNGAIANLVLSMHVFLYIS